MSSGGGGDSIGRGIVEIRADTDLLDRELGGLSARVGAAVDRASAGATVRIDTSQVARGRQDLIGLANILDDLQYVPEMGLRPILNNLAQFAPQVAIVGIGIDLLWRNWGKLFGEMNKGLPDVALATLDQMKDRLKEIDEELGRVGKSWTAFFSNPAGAAEFPKELERRRLEAEKGRIEEEQARRRAIDEAGKAAGAIVDRPTVRQEQAGKAFTEAAREFGGQKLRDALVESLRGAADARGQVVDPSSNLVGTPEQVADLLFQAAAKGDAVALAEVRRAGAGPGGGFGGVMDRIQMAPLAAAEAAAERDLAERQAKEKIAQAEADDRREKEGAEEGRRAQRGAQERAIFDQERAVRGARDRLGAIQEQAAEAQRRPGVQFQGVEGYLKDIQAGAFDRSEPMRQLVENAKKQVEILEKQLIELQDKKRTKALAELG